ncbi:MAG: restriction endonuclease subunit S [Bacillota bacterium]|nr:restriction endonuclease subunit S [Bacillota bacterium]
MADESCARYLGDVADIVMGQSPPGGSVSPEPRGLPLLNGPTEFGPHHPAPVQFTVEVKKRAFCGDILFCVRGSTTGRMNWADQEYAIGRGVAAIRHKYRPELQPLVRAVIEYHLPNLLAQATGSTFPNVSAEQLARIPWPQLPEAEQLAISHILGTLDEKIELNRRLSETLETMAGALFKSWFVDFEPVRAKMEGRWRRGESIPGLPSHLYNLFPDRLVESELGAIPEGWEVVPLRDVLTPSIVRAIEANLPEYSATVHGLFPRSDRFKKQLAQSKAKNKKVEAGDLVFGLSRRVINFGLMREEKGCVSPVYEVFKVNSARIDPDLLEQSIRIRMQDYLDILRPGAREGQPIDREYFLSKRITIPDQQVQQEFRKLVGPYVVKWQKLESEQRTFAGLRDTLLPKLISGELRVTDAKRFLP